MTHDYRCTVREAHTGLDCSTTVDAFRSLDEALDRAPRTHHDPAMEQALHDLIIAGREAVRVFKRLQS